MVVSRLEVEQLVCGIRRTAPRPTPSASIWPLRERRQVADHRRTRPSAAEDLGPRARAAASLRVSDDRSRRSRARVSTYRDALLVVSHQTLHRAHFLWLPRDRIRGARRDLRARGLAPRAWGSALGVAIAVEADFSAERSSEGPMESAEATQIRRPSTGHQSTATLRPSHNVRCGSVEGERSHGVSALLDSRSRGAAVDQSIQGVPAGRVRRIPCRSNRAISTYSPRRHRCMG
jgi:hypothetical protein